ncbi:MAG: carboxypeptidase-like regulatory domain-containing protein, partial [Ignavibacteria bacterium]|nr:carboxypeptidase-like regulatory domain-containing protein [Ignavibacteria bacterium]
MKKYLLSFFSFLLFFFLLSQSQLYAGGTGKIAGKVTDTQTGEELIGINVLVEGTTTGAATGVDGRYVINNIEPGV